MKKFLIAAAGLSALAATAPAAAQYYPGQPAPYGGYNQGYGYNNQQQLVQFYLQRTDQLRLQVESFQNRSRLSNREVNGLRNQAVDLQNRARSYVRGGINPGEQRDLDVRIARLQQRIAVELRDNNNRYGNGYGRGVGGGRDRDRDGIRDNRDGYVDLNRNGVDDRREGFIDNNRNGIDDRREGYPYRR